MNGKKIRNIFKKEDGAGLVLVLMVLIVLAVLGVAVAGVTIGSHKLGHINRDSNSAYYIAEAGANLAYEDIKRTVMDHYNNSPNEGIYFGNISDFIYDFYGRENGREYVGEFDPQFGDQPKATIQISEAEPVSDGNEYTIISTGEIAGKSRTVEKPFTVKWVKKDGGGIGLPRMPDDAVIIAKGDLDFDHNTIIYGDVLLEGGIKIKKNFVHITPDGESHKDVKGIIEGPIDMTPYENIFASFPSTPDSSFYNISYSGSTISENTYLESLNVNEELTFNTDDGSENGKEINLVVDNLTVSDYVRISGLGTVNIYVKEKLTFANKNLNINWDGSADQLNFFYSGYNEVEAKKNFNFKGTLFLKNAGISINKNLDIDGIIISKKDIKFKKEVDTVVASIFAPYSKVSFDKELNFTGTIVAKEIKNSTSNISSTFTYALNDYLESYPYEPGEGSGSGSGGTGTINFDDLISAGPALEP